MRSPKPRSRSPVAALAITFTRLIPSGPRDMQRVYRLLKEAARARRHSLGFHRRRDARELERVASWSDPEEYIDATIRDYRRDYWDQQPCRVEVWSEKGHRARSAAARARQVRRRFSCGAWLQQRDAGARRLQRQYRSSADHHLCRRLRSERTLYVRMRSARQVFEVRRISHHTQTYRADCKAGRWPAIVSGGDKKKDPRYKWFVKHYGKKCWELDALDPNDLRNIVQQAIRKEIEPVAWKRCTVVEKAEKESLRTVLDRMGRVMTASSPSNVTTEEGGH